MSKAIASDILIASQDMSPRVQTTIRQIKASISKAEAMVEDVRLRVEGKTRVDLSDATGALTRRLRRLRLMLQRLGGLRASIQDPVVVGTARNLMRRYDRCVRSLDALTLHDAVQRRSEAVRSGRYSPKETRSLLFQGQEMRVPVTPEVETALARSKRLDALRDEVREVLELFEDVKELTQASSQVVSEVADRVDDAKVKVTEAEEETRRAVNYKHSALGWVFVGGAVGAVVGGPLGFFYGSLKAAGMGLAGGSAGGMLGGWGLSRGIRRAHNTVRPAVKSGSAST